MERSHRPEGPGAILVRRGTSGVGHLARGHTGFGRCFLRKTFVWGVQKLVHGQGRLVNHRKFGPGTVR